MGHYVENKDWGKQREKSLEVNKIPKPLQKMTLKENNHESFQNLHQIYLS
jgi:hypothetical protein